MSKSIKTAIRATVAALKAELASGKTEPQLRDLTKEAIEAAERVVGTTSGNAETRSMRPR